MPCFNREKSLSIRRPRRDKANDRDGLAPKPVRPRAMKYHGLLGMSIAAQHLIVDEKWTPDSLSEQYSGFTDLLNRRIIYKRHETKSNRKRLLQHSRRLKMMCTDGRIKLQKISTGNNAHKIRNLLIKHRDMQRLYQKMPIHMVADNINQRTFVLRKERDRLLFRLEQMKKEYKNLLLDRSEVENLIRYENEFVLEEELLSRVLLKKIENSNVRFKAITTINTTYRKIIQVLLQDEIFYEPILRSLDSDIEDQGNFIKNILYIGKPAIVKFKELNKEYRMLMDKSRNNLQAKLLMLASLKKPPTAFVPVAEKPPRMSVEETDAHYVRQTRSMLKLKSELAAIETTIKNLKFVTLCSQAREIYPRVKGQLENNLKLKLNVELDLQNHQMRRTKMKYTQMLQDVLLNNLSEEEMNRLDRISDLKEILKKDEEFERDILSQIKSRADIYVIFRLSLWNLLDILRHIDRAPRTFRFKYRSSYLKLPLLKFEMHNMYAAAPELYEEDYSKLMILLKRKVYKLMKAFKAIDPTPEMIEHGREAYHMKFLSGFTAHDNIDEDHQQAAIDDDDDKAMAAIPSRKLLKAQSARLVEEASKRDED
ncbi:uncharacterized protein LOC117576003 isoform X1 [Drosophila albomicans]|uniref:Uncharacterized protein LOC117576003 isoform X1 n=1 Tax=Drosophila albomicans TaxID=7291 RepID=A0A6P8XSU7_DROAB|nr:uncharacterized protein LOC117576003 isoform X1 [Drosophila albomicans]